MRIRGREHSLHRLLPRLNMMEHGPGCHHVVGALFNRIFEDIELADFEVWRTEVGDVA